MKTMQGLVWVGTLVIGALGFAGSAQARDNVYWSLGVGGPGVAVGVGNVPPVVYAPPPVYVAPQPVYVRPRPVYMAPPPAYYAPPVVYRPAPQYYYGPPGHHKPRKWRKHRHHDRYWD